MHQRKLYGLFLFTCITLACGLANRVSISINNTDAEENPTNANQVELGLPEEPTATEDSTVLLPSPSPSSTQTPMPTTTQPTSTLTATPAMSLVRIQNLSRLAICGVYMVPTGSFWAEGWGEDLSGQYAIAEGDSHEFYYDIGQYDVLLSDCWDNVLYQRSGMLFEGALTEIVYDKAISFITIENNTYTSLCKITYAELDMLGESILHHGDSTEFWVENSSREFWIQNCFNEDVLHEEYFLVEGDMTLSFSNQEWEAEPATPSATFYLQNNHEVDICYVYIDPVGSSGIGDDRTGSHSIRPGVRYYFRLPYSLYDFRIWDCSGNLIDSGFNIPINPDTTWFTSP